ncbi:hypothetical protein [Lactobacillus johnsonii]|uniref:Uncharacterized protein n=1 Tax=Lactobacillus johnsonii TaxID=33959 RepID=A0A9X7XVC4_LACJH|nr:hypothetical protein [Lactobacillus johnsonii]QIA88459.1 hypothetical protein FEE39_09415 [Lactobacillus johnsonii]QIA88481.1 hypothetical protein FEE39_09535 [Lactobacillus johnsonii]
MISAEKVNKLMHGKVLKMIQKVEKSKNKMDKEKAFEILNDPINKYLDKHIKKAMKKNAEYENKGQLLVPNEFEIGDDFLKEEEEIVNATGLSISEITRLVREIINKKMKANGFTLDMSKNYWIAGHNYAENLYFLGFWLAFFGVLMALAFVFDLISEDFFWGFIVMIVGGVIMYVAGEIWCGLLVDKYFVMYGLVNVQDKTTRKQLKKGYKCQKDNSEW